MLSCFSCGKKGTGANLKRCTGCKTAHYCDVTCQRNHRPAHKKECKMMERLSRGIETPSSGEIVFTSERPQTYLFCGHCDTHFMLCACEDVEHGKDYIFKFLPPPPANLSPIGRMRRFASLVAATRTMGRFNALAWHSNEASAVVASIQARKSQLKQMEDYVTDVIPTDPNLKELAFAAGGQPLKEQPASVQAEIVAREGRAAIDIFISGDWSTMTSCGAVLLNNSYQASDSNKYPLSDSDLKKVFEGVGCLVTILQLGYTNVGWRYALECDRVPVGTDLPWASVTDRDYLLQYAKAHPE